QLDANSVRVIIKGTGNAPDTRPVERKQNGLTFALVPSMGSSGDTAASQPIQNNQIAQSAPASPGLEATPAPPAGPDQSMNQAPPFLPRAVAPPVGDIAISNTDASPSVIDLGTQQRVPRLVLRDAPVREVLSLLARAANLNLAYTAGGTGEGQGAATGTSGGDGPTISLDIENEPVQDVFNYVLRLSGLEANRSGRTVFVGTKLPNSTRDTIMRNMRLNQVTVDVALNFLVGLGAETAVSRERQVTNVNAVPVGQGAAPITQTQTTTETRVETQRIDFEDSSPLLRGLQALGDERTNSVTLIGEPRTIQIAMAQLTQLDIRRRQVAVNVKIVDVNLLKTKDFKTSFSFGVADNFFSVDGGVASGNFGSSRPPTSAESRNSITSRPVIENPVEGSPFFDPNNSVGIPGTLPGTIVVDQNGNTVRTQNSGSGNFYQPTAPFGTDGDPLSPGFSSITPATDNIVTFDEDGNASVAQGTLGTATASLPTLFQFPKKFLASLQTQVSNGNAKILTDPTLIVQEGQEARVDLTSEVLGRVTTTFVDTPGGSREVTEPEKEKVGLTVGVKVERVDDNGFVSLSVAPSVKAPAGQQNTGNGFVTLISERSLQSGLVRMRDGQTLILSGIIQESDRVTVSKTPILGDIPIIGSLFRSTNKNNQRNEVIVLLTPQVMDDSQGSSYGYNYKPSPEVRRMLRNRGLKLPRR
ncbi:MAG: secretin and TonB N-terminal domain-containing protein, partial [Cyanobacteria bacterium P01_A01_bin.68]